jgi:uncharacterized protein
MRMSQKQRMMQRTGLQRRIGRMFVAAVVCAALWGTAWPARAEKIADLQPSGYVNDFAGVLAPATRSRLEALCTAVDQQAHAQIAVVTVHTTGDDPIDDFAVRLEEKWKVGPKGSDRGLLLILATDDHHYRFEVGYGLESILPDGLVGDFGRQMVPYLRRNDYDDAVTLGVQSAARVIASDAKVTLAEDVQTAMPQPTPRPLRLAHDIFLAIVVLVVFLWLMRSGPSGLPGFLLGMLLGNILGGGGGGGGGGFDDRDGGGGGGFGGFGGGSSGGGGASGSW